MNLHFCFVCFGGEQIKKKRGVLKKHQESIRCLKGCRVHMVQDLKATITATACNQAA